jgi:hypothetical protein
LLRDVRGCFRNHRISPRPPLDGRCMLVEPMLAVNEYYLRVAIDPG